MNMHGMQHGAGPMPIVAGGVSPVMMQASPQQAGSNVMPPGQQQQVQQMQQQAPNPMQQQQQQDKIDNISKVKALLPPLRESTFMTLRAAAFAVQQNSLADNLKRDANVTHPPRFDKHLEEFSSYCDQIELQLKTAIQCTQQLASTQHYMPAAVGNMRMEPYMQDNPAGPMPYSTFLATARAQVQSAKDLHDTLISAAQNISQAD